MIAVSVYLKTESCDEYHFLSNHEDIVKEVVDNMGDEIKYVNSMEINVYPYVSAIYENVSYKLDEVRGNV